MALPVTRLVYMLLVSISALLCQQEARAQPCTTHLTHIASCVQGNWITCGTAARGFRSRISREWLIFPVMESHYSFVSSLCWEASIRVCSWSLLSRTDKTRPMFSFGNETWYYTNESLGTNDDHVLKTNPLFSHEHYILCKMPLFISKGPPQKYSPSVKVINIPNQK